MPADAYDSGQLTDRADHGLLIPTTFACNAMARSSSSSLLTSGQHAHVEAVRHRSQLAILLVVEHREHQQAGVSPVKRASQI